MSMTAVTNFASFMNILRSDAGSETFFARLRTAKTSALILDYDGTLAPFEIDRRRARPYPGVLPLLQRIQRTGLARLILVSGRPIADLVSLLPLEPLPELWGCHGWERRTADSACRLAAEPPEELRSCLQRASQWAQAEGLGDRCEVKPVGVALHWRGLDEHAVQRLRDRATPAWQALLGSGLELREFDGGLEIRASGQNKGNAVRAIRSELADETLCAYCGDDTTDEDAFRALAGRGLSVLVRPQLRTTTADVWIRPPQGLIEFLKSWLEACEDSCD